MLWVSSICLFSIIIGCNSEGKIKQTKLDSSTSIAKYQNVSVDNSTMFPKTELSDSIAVDSAVNEQSIRAEQKTDKGTLLVVSNGREEKGHLLVSSVWGQEGDYTFQSNYSVVYRQEEKEKVLLVLPAFQYVQPTEKKLSFKHISFHSADIYILTPQYQTGYGAESYLFAIDKQSGDAFHLEINKNGIVSKSLIYSGTTSLPAVEKETLVIHPSVRAGTSEQDAKDMHYRLNLKNKQLIAE